MTVTHGWEIWLAGKPMSTWELGPFVDFTVAFFFVANGFLKQS